MLIITDTKGNKLYNLKEISKLIGFSKSTTRRMANKINNIELFQFKNEFFYDKKSLFRIMEMALYKKL